MNQGSVDGAANGTGPGVALNGASAKSKESLPYNVIAIGSQDCCISVWTTGSPRPVFIGKHFFQQSVVDLSWYVSSLMVTQIFYIFKSCSGNLVNVINLLKCFSEWKPYFSICLCFM